jgi:hypothetical protein
VKSNVEGEVVRSTPATGSTLVGDLRVGARVARRSLRKHWIANLIVIVLIALPVAGIGAISTLVRTDLSTAQAQTKAGEPRRGAELDQWGAADFRLQATGRSVDVEAATVTANLPKGSVVEPESYLLCGRVRASAPGAPAVGKRTKRISAQLYTGNLGSPVFQGRRILSSGTWAKRINEVVISARLAKSLKASPGTRLEGCGQTYTVTGVVSSPVGGRYANEVFVYPSDRLGDSFFVKLPKRVSPSQPLLGLDGKPFSLLDTTRSGPSAAQTLPVVTFVTPAMLNGYNNERVENNVWVIRAIAVMALVVLGSLAAAVFTVSAQRQRQSAGLLSLTGASARAVRFTLLLQGTWCGVLAAILGGAIAVVGLQVLIPFRNEVFSSVLDSYAVVPGDWLWAAAIAVGASTLAALRPARILVTGDLLRSGRDRSIFPRFVTTAGRFAVAVLAAVGFGILTSGSNGNRVNLAPRSWALPFAVLAVMASAAAVWIGAPLLLRALTIVMSRFPSFRLSARSLTRNPNRSAATMSGVGVVFGVLVAILLGTSNATAYSADRYALVRGVGLAQDIVIPCAQPRERARPMNSVTPPMVTPNTFELCVTKGLSDQELRKAERIIGQPVVTIRRYQAKDGGPLSVTVANAALIQALGLSTKERSILEREGILDARLDGTSGAVYRRVDGQEANAGAPIAPGLGDLVREDVIRSASFTQMTSPMFFPDSTFYLVTEKALLDPAKMAEKALEVSVTHVELKTPLSGQQRDELQELIDVHYGGRSTSDLAAARGQLITFPPPDTTSIMARVRLIASVIAGAIALLSIALSLALSSVETRNDHHRLKAIGASPKTIRRLRTQSSAVLAFGGCLTAALVAMPVFRMVLWANDNRSDHVRHPIPFAALSVTIVAITAAAAFLGFAFRSESKTKNAL